MSETASCPRCDAPLPEGRLEGLCPRCLLRSGLVEPSVATPEPFEPPSVEALDARIPGYEILEPLGRGGMGAVYKARQRKLDRLVAVKVLPPEVGADPTFAERFAREARALARLGHPHIVTIHDFGEADGLYFLVMEYVEGRNLRSLLRTGRPAPDVVIRMIGEVLGALRYAHGKGVIHRDIKPENILVDEDGHVRITDFGLAKLVETDERDATLTGTQQAMGTPHYMAPEQIETPSEVDHRADLYSLGVVLYELLTGALPLGRFPAPSAKASTPAWLDDVVMRALEREPEDRYASADEMAKALDRTAPVTKPERARLRPERAAPSVSLRSAGDRKTLNVILAAAVVAGISVFLNWVSLPFPGRDRLSEMGGFPFEDFVGVMTITGVKVETFGLPGWLLVLAAAVLAALAAGQAFGGWPNLWKGMVAASGYGVLHILVVVIGILDSTAGFEVGIVICALAFVLLLVLSIRMSPLRPRVPNRNRHSGASVRRGGRRRRRSSPTVPTPRKGDG